MAEPGEQAGWSTGPHRQQTARWAAVAAAEFRQRVMHLGEAVDTEIATWEAERDTVRTELEEAASLVKQDAASFLAVPAPGRTLPIRPRGRDRTL